MLPKLILDKVEEPHVVVFWPPLPRHQKRIVRCVVGNSVKYINVSTFRPRKQRLHLINLLHYPIRMVNLNYVVLHPNIRINISIHKL